VLEDQRRADGRAALEAAGVDPQLLDHVELPEDLPPGRLGADQFAGVGDVVEAPALHHGRRDEAYLRRVDGLVELLVDDLPEELAGLLVEAHQHPAVAPDRGVAWTIIVGADEDASLGDDGPAVADGAEFGLPLDVPGGLLVDVPGVGDVLLGS